MIPQRYQLRPVEVDPASGELHAEQGIIVLLGAANRVPIVFPNPNVLDIARKGMSHIFFGRGIHYSLGAPLALLAARIAFASLLSRFKFIRLKAEPAPLDRAVLRGAADLWLAAVVQ